MNRLNKRLVSLLASTMMIANCSGLAFAEEIITEDDNSNIEEVEVISEETQNEEQEVQYDELDVVEEQPEDTEQAAEEEIDEEEIESENVGSEITITKQPVSYTGASGTKASFSVTATGDSLTYLWQYQLAGKTTWSSWTSKTDSSMSITVSDTYDGAKVRCQITDKNKKVVYSNSASIFVGTPLEITTQPESYVGAAGTKASFAITANGDGLTYLWQYQYAGTTKWNSWTSKVNASMSVTISDTYDGAKVRCRVTDSHGNVTYSKSAKISVGTPMEVLEQPQNYIGAAGTKATFSVIATGDDISYLWQYQYAGTTSWNSWTSKTTASTSITISDAYNGAKVRCKITDSHGNVIYSESAKITVGTPIEILEQPANYIGAAGTKATFTVNATGDGITYLWQYQLAGKTSWSSWTSKTTASTSITISETYNGAKVRCKITDKNGNVKYSSAAKITIGNPIVISQHPQDMVGPIGTSASFSVVATGDDITYLWQYQKAGKTSWSSWTSKTTASSKVTISDELNGAKVRCKITDKNDNVVYSNYATIYVGTKFEITKQPTDIKAAVDSTVSVSVTAKGSGLKYLWQYQTPGKTSWSSWTSKTTATASIKITDSLDGAKIRCKVTDSHGAVLYTKEITVTTVIGKDSDSDTTELL